MKMIRIPVAAFYLLNRNTGLKGYALDKSEMRGNVFLPIENIACDPSAPRPARFTGTIEGKSWRLADASFTGIPVWIEDRSDLTELNNSAFDDDLRDALSEALQWKISKDERLIDYVSIDSSFSFVELFDEMADRIERGRYGQNLQRTIARHALAILSQIERHEYDKLIETTRNLAVEVGEIERMLGVKADG